MSAKQELVSSVVIDEIQEECRVVIDHHAPSRTEREPEPVAIEVWLNCIMEKKKETNEKENRQAQGLKIPKVSPTLREKQKDSYEPSKVSIGPYHYDSHNSAEVMQLKRQMTREFIKRRKKRIQHLYEKVKNIATEARQNYDWCSTRHMNDEEFTKMMFLDGCFILEFIHSLTRNYKSLDMSDEDVGLVQRDLLLLENQLPFIVLDSLMEETNETMNIEFFIELLVLVPQMCLSTLTVFLFIVLFCILPTRLFEWLLNKADLMWRKEGMGLEKPVHVLGYLYDHLVDKKSKLCKDRKTNDREDEYKNAFIHREKIHGKYLSSSAKYLKKKGIYFRQSKSGAFPGVRFKPSLLRGKLYLPQIRIDKTTKSTLLNLLAYENEICHIDKNLKPWVSSYLYFMDSLINDADDVKELRLRNIIVNAYGSCRTFQ